MNALLGLNKEQIIAKRTKRNHSANFKAKVTLTAMAGDKTLSELAEQYGVHPNQITTWKRQLVEQAASVYSKVSSSEPAVDLKALHAEIGQLTVENVFLEGALKKAGLLSTKR